MGKLPLRAAIIGMGGFAQEHHRVLRALEQEGQCRLVCTCDPNLEAFRESMAAWRFAERGVRAFPDYRQMLEACAAELDLVTVPTPVPLHAPMHRACVEHGLACYLEKPPTLDSAELEEMLAAEARAAKSTMVGFSFIVEAPRQQLKQRLLQREFGPVRAVRFLGLWPRATTYFTRAPWAGRLLLDGKLVLDSCIGNAMAHYIHNLLFWAGQEELLSWEPVVSAQAELYRAHAIESLDTVFARGLCANGVEVQVAATHAVAGPHEQWERVECEQAAITYITRRGYRIDWKDGRQEAGPADNRDLLLENVRDYFRYLRGEASRPLTRLIDSRPFVGFYDLLFVAAGSIATVPETSIQRTPVPSEPGEYVAVEDIRAACEDFLATGRFPSQQGMAWGQTGGQATEAQIPQLWAVVEKIAGTINAPTH
ncbi:MAG TPA: Gfo/Idh/MocA family oxidoreductase [Chthonomonadaceae bacterium]|nr:Gfo/Idh/MocA family oxidoreductase [Chthonomonadaceae bacterium]